MKVRENITLYAGAEAERAVVGKHESEKTEYVDKKTQEHDRTEFLQKRKKHKNKP